jgi:signal transduction histidine kinase
MMIGMTDTDTLTDEQLAIARRVADQLAIALYQARLYQQAQQYAQELEQSNRALALVNEASRTFTATLDEERVFDVILEEARHLLEADAMAVWLPDPDTEDLICHRVFGLPKDRLQGWRLPRGEGIVGWVAQHGEPLIVPDLQDDERHAEEVTERAGIASRSLLSVPLHFKDERVGVIQAVDVEPDYFNADHLAQLEPLAASAVIAIENARLFEEVRLTREQLRALSRSLVGIQEAERAAVARELHDEAGQSLSYLLLALGILKREAGDAEAVHSRAEMLEEMIDSLLENLHRMAARLRPAALEHLGLIPALEQYVETFINQSGIPTQFEVVALKGERLSPELETALYRVVQEALTNVTRHAEATHVDVLLELRGDQVVLIVEDNGVGFDVETATEEGRLGLVGMRERAQMLGGTWMIESTPGKGTTIVVEVPYDHSDLDR